MNKFDDSVSRAAILLERRGDEIFIFDKGSLTPVSVTQEKIQVRYDPTMKTANGYGGSIQVNINDL